MTLEALDDDVYEARRDYAGQQELQRVTRKKAAEKSAAFSLPTKRATHQ
jgi:hypothetical protein